MGRKLPTATSRAPKPRKVVPVRVLILLFACFAGALGLKAWEERKFADNAMLDQGAGDAQAAAAQVRAEMAGARTRMEALLASGATLDAIRKGVPFDRVSERAPPTGVWAMPADKDSVLVFAQAPGGRWVSGLVANSRLLPEMHGDARVSIASIPNTRMDSRFDDIDGARSAIACAPIAESGIAACVIQPAPMLGLNDLNRIVLYLMLLAAPLLAVTGLLQVIGRISREDAAADMAASAAPALPPPPPRNTGPVKWAELEVPGLIGFWSWNPTHRTVTLSETAAAMLGALQPGELRIEEIATLINDDDKRRVIAAFQEATRASRINTAFRGVAQQAGSHFEMVGGPSDGGFAGTFVNVTDRIQAQHRSRRAEALARMALEAHPGPFAVWDSRKRLTHYNSALQKVFNLDDSVLRPGASYDQVMAEIAKFVRIERPSGDESNSREVLTLADQWMRLMDRRTANDGLITVGHDISALKHQESRLSKSSRTLRAMVVELERTKGQAQELAHRFNEQKQRAERASQSKSVFLANMSHELRTPLNAINGFSEMIRDEVYGPIGDERYRGYAEDILASGQHLLDMINDILDMAKIEAGKMQIAPRPIDPSDAVDSAVRLIRRRAADKGVSLVFDPDEDIPEINGDHRAIKQMTLNLLANAIKFTDPEGSIRATIGREGEWLAVHVIDTGIGIAEADLPRLGQAFEQAKAPDGRNAQGTGLGLALTKSFAEMHGGYLDIKSKVGEGTTVSIYLPIPKPGEAPPAPKPATQADDADDPLDL